ncbi:transposase, partial [Escherichia coli]
PSYTKSVSWQHHPDYEVQKYLSFQLPVIRYRERFWQYME